MNHIKNILREIEILEKNIILFKNEENKIILNEIESKIEKLYLLLENIPNNKIKY